MMNAAEVFLGEEQNGVSIDETLFNSLFAVGTNKDLFVIKSKNPIPYQDITNQHVHKNFEFTIPLSHSPKLLIENKQFTLPHRSIFSCNPGQYHGPAEAVRQHRIIALQLTSHKVEEIADLLFGERNIEFQNVPYPFDLNLENLIDMFIYEGQHKQAGSEFILDHLSSIIGSTIVRTFKSNLGAQEKELTDVSRKQINQVLDYLHSNINQNFSLDDLANLVSLSKYHFIRVFKKEIGKTPYQYFLEIKINKAVELIKTDKYSITDICFLCGFTDHSHFSRVFRSKTGFSPSLFKDMRR